MKRLLWKEEVKLVMTSLVLPEEVLDLLRTKAFMQKRSISSLIREAIYSYLNIDKKQYERR